MQMHLVDALQITSFSIISSVIKALLAGQSVILFIIFLSLFDIRYYISSLAHLVLKM